MTDCEGGRPVAVIGRWYRPFMNELLPELRTARPEDLSDRLAFDEHFLGRPFPTPTLNGTEAVLLPHTHFSILMRLPLHQRGSASSEIRPGRRSLTLTSTVSAR